MKMKALQDLVHDVYRVRKVAFRRDLTKCFGTYRMHSEEVGVLSGPGGGVVRNAGSHNSQLEYRPNWFVAVRHGDATLTSLDCRNELCTTQPR